MTTPDRFKAARAKRGLSQAKLAKLLEIDQSMVAQIETGRRNLSLDRIAEYADRLGWPRSELSPELVDRPADLVSVAKQRRKSPGP
jgi:transcriptional regulator with XRE-family HTH domain